MNSEYKIYLTCLIEYSYKICNAIQILSKPRSPDSNEKLEIVDFLIENLLSKIATFDSFMNEDK